MEMDNLGAAQEVQQAMQDMYAMFGADCQEIRSQQALKLKQIVDATTTEERAKAIGEATEAAAAPLDSAVADQAKILLDKACRAGTEKAKPKGGGVIKPPLKAEAAAAAAKAGGFSKAIDIISG